MIAIWIDDVFRPGNEDQRKMLIAQFSTRQLLCALGVICGDVVIAPGTKLLIDFSHPGGTATTQFFVPDPDDDE